MRCGVYTDGYSHHCNHTRPSSMDTCLWMCADMSGALDRWFTPWEISSECTSYNRPPIHATRLQPYITLYDMIVGRLLWVAMGVALNADAAIHAWHPCWTVTVLKADAMMKRRAPVPPQSIWNDSLLIHHSPNVNSTNYSSKWPDLLSQGRGSFDVWSPKHFRSFGKIIRKDNFL